MTAVPAAGVHGGDGVRVAEALGLDPSAVLDLSASFNPVAPDPGEVVAGHVDAIGRYPAAGPATEALAAAMDVDPGRLLLTNGGAEAIALVATELGPGWADPCEFGLYRRHIPRLDPGGPLFRSNPHNPTGRLAPQADHAEVWDEAFYPLATGRWTRGDQALVVGSLTKLFACPGLRVGYVLAPETGGGAALIEKLALSQPRWSVNGLATAALPELLETADLATWAAAVAELRQALVQLLRAHGLDPQPSDANYVLCAGAPGLRERLAPHGVLVRDCTSFGLPSCVRVAVPDVEGLTRLEEALAALRGWEGAACAAG
ncbi:MAG: aminotransferase class I/II-fold pyridoxal phosphate-dependent enzyme [Actinomycetota bacterium]|nr:aminotransferase class I/II-fold pyridoxal phosphate-dependent enzyme [Actinomycetota bacterium]